MATPVPATDGPDDPCAPQYKLPSYDRRAFFELASGFLVPQDRAFPYVVTPSIVVLRPLDARYRWSLSGSIAARFGDDRSAGTLGARLYRSMLSGSSTIMPRLAIGLGPELVLAHDGGMDVVAEATVDLTPILLGVRGAWGPVTFRHSAFGRPARLETFFGWRISGWRRKSTPLETLLHQPPPPRRRFRPQPETEWADDIEAAVRGLSDPVPYLSLVQQLSIRLGAQFDHASQDCGRQKTRLEDARHALSQGLRQDSQGPMNVRQLAGLENLLREQSEAFVSILLESLEYSRQFELYQPDPLLLGPAMLHAMNCVLEGALSSRCVSRAER